MQAQATAAHSPEAAVGRRFAAAAPLDLTLRKADPPRRERERPRRGAMGRALPLPFICHSYVHSSCAAAALAALAARERRLCRSNSKGSVDKSMSSLL